MRYTIGCKLIDKNSQKEYECVALIMLNVAYIIEKERLNKKNQTKRIPIFENIDDAQLFLTEMAKSYRRCNVKNEWEKADCSFKFYLVKVDSKKFDFKLGDKIKEETVKFRDFNKQMTIKTVEIYNSNTV